MKTFPLKTRTVTGSFSAYFSNGDPQTVEDLADHEEFSTELPLWVEATPENLKRAILEERAFSPFIHVTFHEIKDSE